MSRSASWRMVNGARLADDDLLVDCDGRLYLVHYWEDLDDPDDPERKIWSAWWAVQEDRRRFLWHDEELWWDHESRPDLGDYQSADEVLAYLRSKFDNVEIVSE